MVQVISGTIFLLLLARLLRMPAGTWRFIVGGAILVLAGTQLLPVGTPLREDVRSSLGGVLWLGLAASTVVGYALIVRSIRRRTRAGCDDASPARPRGLVLVPEDSALVRDTEAALAREGPGRTEHVSVAWRDGEGGLAGHARARIRDDLAEIELIWVAPAARRQGIGSRLLHQAETEARLRGAGEMLAAASTDDAVRFLARRGFRPYAAFGCRRHLHKRLP